MHKIMVKTKDNIISFSLTSSSSNTKNINNTNVITTEKMIFSDDYINDNIELIESFFNLIIVKKNIDTVNVEINAIFPLVYRIIKNIPNIKNVNFNEDKNIGYIVFEKLLDSKYIEKVNLYSISSFMLDKLSRDKDILISTRCEVLYLSNFMETNNFTSYSDVYYKKIIDINCDLSKEDKEDIESFFRFNDKVRIVNLYNFKEEDILYILEQLKLNNKKNIKIVLNQKDCNNEIIKIFDKVEKKYKKLIKDNNYKIKVKYTKEYKEKNILKQVNLTFFRIILLIFIVIALLVIVVFYIKYNGDVDSIEEEISDIEDVVEINEIDEYKAEDEEVTEEDLGDGGEEAQSEEDNKKAKAVNSPYYKKFEQTWDKLLKINNETVGWLKVNNTKVNMPVTQHKDNEYYLSYSYYKKKNSHGWVFVDYRNNLNKLDSNTIIYGHRNNLGIMFGSLKNVLEKKWYTNKDNQVITFNTLNQNMKWQIFSIYTIKNTDDYLKVNFYNDSNYTKFIKMIKNRSIYNFKVNVTKDDKILTLSTCYKNSKNRLVIHAKLIK